MQPQEVKQRRLKTPEQALAALMRLCARAEKSESDALRLMHGWEIAPADAQQILDRLVADRFIDDSRYADAFVREKVRLSGWGLYKIRTALQRKGISRERIDQALSQTDRCTMEVRLREQMQRKARSVSYGNRYELKTKLVRYGLSLGYEYESVLGIASEISGEVDEF